MNIVQFPEIAKAVGHKYLKRVPKAGGGYRYIYREGITRRNKKQILKEFGEVSHDQKTGNMWVEVRTKGASREKVAVNNIERKLKQSGVEYGRVEITGVGTEKGKYHQTIIVTTKGHEKRMKEAKDVMTKKMDRGETEEKRHMRAAKKSKVSDVDALQRLFDATPGPKNVAKFMQEERSHRITESIDVAQAILGHKTDGDAVQAIMDIGEDIIGDISKKRALNIVKKMRQGVKKSFNVGAFPEIAKAVGAQRGGKYLKRVPKPGGGYTYVYHSEKHRVAHKAEGMERRAKKLIERARSLEKNDMLAQASKARGKAELLMKLARQSKKGTGTPAGEEMK